MVIAQSHQPPMSPCARGYYALLAPKAVPIPSVIQAGMTHCHSPRRVSQLLSCQGCYPEVSVPDRLSVLQEKAKRGSPSRLNSLLRLSRKAPPSEQYQSLIGDS